MDDTSSLSRRRFLRSVGLATLSAPALGIHVGGCADDDSGPGVPPNVIADIQRPPLAVAMWDFSWLTRRSGAEAEYADFDLILDDFVARGYDCIRLDAFPHLIANDAQGQSQDSFTMLPQGDYFMWGNHSSVTITPRQDLVLFMQKCRDRGIRLGLSSWFQPDTTGREQMVVTPDDMSRVWIETLDWLESNAVLDVVEWVDMCNEFPVPKWAPGAAAHMNLTLADPLTLGNPFPTPFSAEQAVQISEYMTATIGAVRQAHPEQRYCFSFVSGGHAVNYDEFDLSSFDILEPHVWLNFNRDFFGGSGLLGTLNEAPGAVDAAYPLADALYFADRSRWLTWMDETINSWTHLANRWQLPLYISESWGPINYSDLADGDIANDEEWTWVFDISEASIAMAKAHGWTGICSGNFCQPHHPGFYQNIAWHQAQTAIISAS